MYNNSRRITGDGNKRPLLHGSPSPYAVNRAHAHRAQFASGYNQGNNRFAPISDNEMLFEEDEVVREDRGYEYDYGYGRDDFQTPGRQTYQPFTAPPPPPQVPPRLFGTSPRDVRHNQQADDVFILRAQIQELINEVNMLRSENAHLKAAQDALPVQLGKMVRDEVVKQCTEKLKDTVRDVIVTQAQPIIKTQADHLLNGIHSQVHTLTSEVKDLKVNASNAAASRYSKSSSGFTSVSGVRFDIINVPVSYNYGKVKDALADFFELPKGDAFPKGVIGDLKCVFRDADKNFSIWKFYLYSEDLMPFMQDHPYINVTTASVAVDSGDSTPAAPNTRRANIYASESDEVEAQHRARGPIYKQIRALGSYKVVHRRVKYPYALNMDTKQRFDIKFNDTNTAAEFNGKTYHIVTGPGTQPAPGESSKSDAVPK